MEHNDIILSFYVSTLNKPGVLLSYWYYRAPHQVGLEKRTLHGTGFYSLHQACPAWKFKLLSRVYRLLPDRSARSSKSPQSGFYCPAPGAGPLSTLRQVHRSGTGSAWLLYAARVHRPRLRGRPVAHSTSGSPGLSKAGPYGVQGTRAPAHSGLPGYHLSLCNIRF